MCRFPVSWCPWIDAAQEQCVDELEVVLPVDVCHELDIHFQDTHSLCLLDVEDHIPHHAASVRVRIRGFGQKKSTIDSSHNSSDSIKRYTAITSRTESKP